MMKKPKILSALMVLGLSASLLGQVPVMAEEADQTQTTDAAGGITTNSISGWPQASDISSEAAVVMENSTNTVLYSKNADEVLFPGSTVKIMTWSVERQRRLTSKSSMPSRQEESPSRVSMPGRSSSRARAASREEKAGFMAGAPC